MLDAIYHTSAFDLLPQQQHSSQRGPSLRPSSSTASIPALLSPNTSTSLSGYISGSRAGEPYDDDDTPRPQFRHWRPHSTSSFPPVNKFTLAGVLHTSTSSHQLNRLGYTLEANSDERNATILPPYISPADSPTDRPSTPLPGKFQDAEGLGAILRPQTSIDTTVDWDEKLGTTSPESYVGEGSVCSELRSGISCDDDPTKRPAERSISAVMATESNSRSRKATQRLGLFRENEQAIEERGREKQRREEKEREKEKERQEKQRAKDTEREERKKAAAEGKEQGVRVPLITEAEENEKKLPQESPSNSLSVSRTKDDRYSTSSRDELSTSKAVPGDTPSSVSHFVPRYPADVTPVVSLDINESAFDPSPSRLAQRDVSKAHGPSTIGTSPSEISASTVVQEKLSDSLSIEISRRSTERAPAGQDEEDEDEESDKDEISSALYFPHPAPPIPPDSTIAKKKAGSVTSQNNPLMWKDATGVDVTRDDTLSAPREAGPEFDLSIQSGDDEYHYHAERRNRTNTDDDYSSYHSNNEGYSSAASGFSEYSDSNDEFSGNENGPDGSEVDTTPTATPVTRHRDSKHDHHPYDWTSNKSHSSTPAEMAPQVPLGAVELKPYNHQVGGHTALFRFSRRAVCKSLSNKENEFYEAVEKRHPELLGFLPK